MSANGSALRLPSGETFIFFQPAFRFGKLSSAALLLMAMASAAAFSPVSASKAEKMITARATIERAISFGDDGIEFSGEDQFVQVQRIEHDVECIDPLKSEDEPEDDCTMQLVELY